MKRIKEKSFAEQYAEKIVFYPEEKIASYPEKPNELNYDLPVIIAFVGGLIIGIMICICVIRYV